MTYSGNVKRHDRYDAFDQLADLVNTGQLSMLGAEALWYELSCRSTDRLTPEDDAGRRLEDDE